MKNCPRRRYLISQSAPQGADPYKTANKIQEAIGTQNMDHYRPY